MSDADFPETDDAAWAPRPAAPVAAGPLLPGYRDAVVVARGGDSVVYRAHQKSVDRDVAIKVVELDDPDAIARFRRELEITVRLGRQHPNIMTVLAVATTSAGQPCLVMDYVELGSLHDRIRAHGPLPVSEVVAAGSVVADALAFAHAQGVLHRDVKPQNVLVLPTSWVLADFGLARAIDAGHSSSLERFSYRHASPQILDGEKPTVADDVYSLGSTLFTLLDGRAPFAADDPDEDSALSYLRRARTGSPRTLSRDDVPVQLSMIVARCLARSRDDRFASAAELRDALDAVPTETRSWAPDAAAEASPPVVAPVIPPVPPVQPAVTPQVAPPDVDLRDPEPVAVSALAHLPGLAPPEPDADATGRPPVETPPPAPSPPRRRWLALTALAGAALVAGVVIGVVRSGSTDDPVTDRTTPVPSSSASQPAVVVPDVTGTPTGPSGSAVFDPRLAPTITALVRTDNGVDLRWRNAATGSSPVVVFLDDGGARRALATVQPGRTTLSLTSFPTGRHCVRLASVATTPAGDTVFGLSERRCTTK